jgi:hypothetical protein
VGTPLEQRVSIHLARLLFGHRKTGKISAW